MDVKITLEPSELKDPVPKIMADLGFDEIRVIIDPLGLKTFEMIRESNKRAPPRAPSMVSYPSLDGAVEYREYPTKTFRYVRCHNMFTSDTGDRQGEKNAGLVDVSYDEKGLHCNFERLDAAYKVFLDAGCIPFVELGFMPRALAISSKLSHQHDQPDAQDEYWDFDPAEDCDDEDGRGTCASPPRSFTVWVELVTMTITHLQEIFGKEKITEWLFELWNEPDIFHFWGALQEDYFKCFEVTARAIKAIDPRLRIGGPSIARDTGMLKNFLEYIVDKKVPMDFISCHVKGGTPGQFPGPNSDHMIESMKKYVDVIARFKELTDPASGKRVPLLLNEADAFLNCISGIRENQVYAFRETTYYPCFTANYYMKLLEYLRNDAPSWFSLHGVYSDNVHMVDERYPFGGYRSTVTTVPVSRELMGHTEVITPWLLSDGAIDIPERSKKWNVYSDILDRSLLYSIYPVHPAWNEPFIVVKKPIFHVYELLQRLGPREIVVSREDLEKGKHTPWLKALATISKETKEVALLLNFFSEDIDVADASISAGIHLPENFKLDGKDVHFKQARYHELNPASCDAFKKWNEKWSKMEEIGEETMLEILQYNKLELKDQAINKEKDIHFNKTFSLNSIGVWIFQYE